MSWLKKTITKAGPCLLLLFTTLALIVCYPATYAEVPSAGPSPNPGPGTPVTQVYFYPKAGQSIEQQSRDHYECYNWAVQQTGFDPSQSSIPPRERVKVVPMPPPGHDTAVLAVAGAVLGAMGGVIGAFAGFEARTRLVSGLKVKGAVIAIAEDIVAIGLACAIVFLM